MPRCTTDASRPCVIERAVPDGTITLDIAGDAYFCLYAPDNLARAPMIPSHAGGAVLPAADPGFDLSGLVSLLLTLARTCVDMRLRSFDELLRRAETAILQVPPTRFDAARYARALAQFERFCLYMPFRFQCLFRAYWLLHFLARSDLRAQWIFGAALFPFEAHCWVASNGYLLGEHAYRLEGLSVLLTVPPEPA